jgi:hypothetical protein
LGVIGNSMKHLFITAIILVLVLFWFIADTQDYFKASYRDLTEQQKAVFQWHSKDSTKNIYKAYQEHFGDTVYNFPRQPVTSIKLYPNKAIIGTVRSMTLSIEDTHKLLSFCNNPNNFNWGETTWSSSEAEYVLKLFNKEHRLVGKVYVCLDDCYMVKSMPFTPNMKFGQLSDLGIKEITGIIDKYL